MLGFLHKLSAMACDDRRIRITGFPSNTKCENLLDVLSTVGSVHICVIHEKKRDVSVFAVAVMVKEEVAQALVKKQKEIVLSNVTIKIEKDDDTLSEVCWIVVDFFGIRNADIVVDTVRPQIF